MNKRFGLVLAAGLTLLIAGCGRQTNQPGGLHPLRLHLSYGDKPGQAVLFRPAAGMNAANPAQGWDDGSTAFQGLSLARAARQVTDQVLLLHCDDESIAIASDASGYGNDFNLYGVTYDTSATAALKKALNFSGSNSYALSESYGTRGGELNGTLGLELSFHVFLTGLDAFYEQRIFDRHDSLGGYTVGIGGGTATPGAAPTLFFRIKQNGIVTTATGRTPLKSRQWYRVTARYDQSNLTLLLDGADEATAAAKGPISPSGRATVIGAGWSDDFIGYPFRGRLDEISLRTTVEYEDLESVNVAVIDISGFTGEEDFYNSEARRGYQAALDSMLADSTFVPTWKSYVRLWGSFFKLASDQQLGIDGAFARGTIYGVEGMNLLLVSGIQDGRITYVGQGMALASREGVTDVYVILWRWDLSG